ncbi:hypothetical protein A3I40_01730 [Candidatus Uhrbacteria bacterium RIFCSPLOWO2_02_FULL_48_12]|uniref:GIY-YIG domain-containing protein n=1 Tax=Candidatus Uhrbacteria bacterium RIFCSPLOWO2_02_FULL_48_12 TaxID=1802407 RepID=A0A1F7V7W4_9BACT|nr:MAG: hypothetical protein A3I40_01730 [Candidatus Uhrbacteria bacterium RIFCSPLOWO2_02_FULL_48_12]
MWYVYVLWNPERNRFYIGSTNDLRRRLAEHRRGKTHSTLRLGSFKLVYCEICLNKQDALDRERQLKTGFGRGYIKRRLKNYLKSG